MNQCTVRTVHFRSIELLLFEGVVGWICGAYGADVLFRHYEGGVAGWEMVEPASRGGLFDA